MKDAFELTRHPDTQQVVLTGWNGPGTPQLVVRERLGGRFLTAQGWQQRSGFAPLVPLPDDPSRLVLQGDGQSLAPGTRVQLEIPAIGFRQEALWPPDLQAFAQELAEPEKPAVRPAEAPPPHRLMARPVPPQPGEPSRPRLQPRPAIPSAIFIAVAALAGLALGAGAVWVLVDYEIVQPLQSALKARSESLEAQKAGLAAQVSAIERERVQLVTDRRSLADDQQSLAKARAQLQNDRQALIVAQRELDAARAQFASELERQRRTQSPPGGPPAANAGDSGVQPDTRGLPSGGPPAADRRLPAGVPQLPGGGIAPPPAPAVQEAALQCDLLAANPYDGARNRDVPGAPIPQLRANSAAALTACRLAMEAYPGVLRYTYQYARALQTSNPAQAADLFKALMDRQYAAAFDNMAWILIGRGDNPAQAEKGADLLRRGIAFGDVDALVSLAILVKDGVVQPRPGEDYRSLLLRASRMGHTAAYDALNEPAKFPTILRRFLGQ